MTNAEKRGILMSEEIEYWFSTANGAHIPVRKGQTKQQALDAFLRANGDPRGMSAAELKKRQAQKTVPLSPSEWARVYERLGEIRRGGRYDKLTNGEKVIPLHQMKEGDTPKLVIVGGTYERPKLITVIEFRSEEEMFEKMERIKK